MTGRGTDRKGLRCSTEQVVRGRSSVDDKAAEGRTTDEPASGRVVDEAAADGRADKEAAAEPDAPDAKVTGVGGALGDGDLGSGREANATNERKLPNPGLYRTSMCSGVRRDPEARTPGRPPDALREAALACQRVEDMLIWLTLNAARE